MAERQYLAADGSVGPSARELDARMRRVETELVDLRSLLVKLFHAQQCLNQTVSMLMPLEGDDGRWH